MQPMMVVGPAPTCQFLMGKHEDFDPLNPRLCGEPSITGFSYCTVHKARCYTGLPPFKPKRKLGSSFVPHHPR